VIDPRRQRVQTVRLDNTGTSSIYSDIMKSALSAYPASRITTVGAGLTLLVTLLAGCGSDPAAEEPGPSAGSILITDANSFQSTATLTVDSAVTAASGTAVSVCWDAPEDLLCHSGPALAVKTVFLFRIAQPDHNEVLRLLVNGELEPHLDSTLRYNVADDLDQDHCATLAEFKSGEDPIANIDAEYFTSAAHSYLLVFSSEEATGQGTLSLKFLEPGAGTTPVQSPTGCGQLAYTVELETLTPVAVPMAGPWPIDWRGLTRTGDGNPKVPFNDIDRVMLVFYEGKDVKFLEENIFDLEQIEGAKYWQLPMTGDRMKKRNTDLSLATDSAGAAFPGFQTAAAGTWALALMCDTCPSPAPIMLTILAPTP